MIRRKQKWIEMKKYYSLIVLKGRILKRYPGSKLPLRALGRLAVPSWWWCWQSLAGISSVSTSGITWHALVSRVYPNAVYKDLNSKYS